MVDTKIGFTYVIEYKDNLSDPEWTPLSSFEGTGDPQFVYDGELLSERRFYRVRQQEHP